MSFPCVLERVGICVLSVLDIEGKACVSRDD